MGDSAEVHGRELADVLGAQICFATFAYERTDQVTKSEGFSDEVLDWQTWEGSLDGFFAVCAR